MLSLTVAVLVGLLAMRLLWRCVRASEERFREELERRMKEL